MKKSIPLSSGTDTEIWMSHNCDICNTSSNCSQNLDYVQLFHECPKKDKIEIKIKQKVKYCRSIYL